MIDWKRVTGFEWGAGNARKSVNKHQVSQFEAEQMFFNNPLLFLEDKKHSEIVKMSRASMRLEEVMSKGFCILLLVCAR